MKLCVTDLTCARGGVAVLDGVDFVLPAGQALVLRGPNGIGKTTLLRTLAGLQPPLRGKISVAPEEIAYAGHADGTKAMLTVAENLAFWAVIHGQQGGEAALRAFDLAALRDRPAGNLSAGQRRRLGLARLLVTGRSIWLLDEPTVSLDAASLGLFAGVVAAHLAQGGSALIASHVGLGSVAADTLDLSGFRGTRPLSSGPFDEGLG